MPRQLTLLSLILALGACSLPESDPDPTTGGPSFALLSLDGNGPRLVAGEAGGAILTSDDGRNWRAWESGTLQPLGAIAWDGSRFTAIGYAVLALADDTQANALLHSPDGITWTVGTLNAHPLEYRRMIWTGSRLVAVGEGILVSEDGDTWTEIPFPDELTASPYLGDVIQTAGRLIAVGCNTVLTSDDDGLNWTARDLPALPDCLEGIADDGTRLVALGGTGAIVTSDDGGLTWQRREAPATPPHLSDVAAGDGGYVAVGNLGALLTSADGIDWQLQTIPGEPILTRVTWTGDRFILVGRNSAVYSYTASDGAEAASVDNGVYGIVPPP